jgi:leucyl aminopeptidase (aminopeptidase T)
MKELVKAIKDLLEINLRVNKGERILVFCDLIREEELKNLDDREIKRRKELIDLSLKVFETAKEYGKAKYLQYEALNYHGYEPPKKLWRLAFGENIYSYLEKDNLLNKIIQKKASEKDLDKAIKIIKKNREDIVEVVIALANFSTTHTKFRELLTSYGKSRYASMPLFDSHMFFTSLDIDWKRLKEDTERLASLLSSAKEITLTSSNRTNLNFKVEGRIAFPDTGILNNPGDFGNLPAGEVYLAPVEEETYGNLVIEYAPTFKLKSPLNLIIREGKVIEIEGKDDYKFFLKKKFKEIKNSDMVGELGIGTNEEARDALNILEAEKIKGSVHVALGDNNGFGGKIKASFHQDYVIFNPTLKIKFSSKEEKIIIENGKILY